MPDPGSPSSSARTYLAPWVLPESGRVLGPGAGLVVRAGQVVACVSGLSAARRLAKAERAPIVDLEHGVLTAGLVNAHSHLELYGLAGEVPNAGGFGSWVMRLMQIRASKSPQVLAEGVARGAARLVETGTTTVGDIDSLGFARPSLQGSGLRVVHFRESLDAHDSERTENQMARLAMPLVDGPHWREGISPHAPFSVSPQLMRGQARIAARRQLPLTIHWSETQAEIDWMAGCSSPLEALLGPGPGVSGLDRIQGCGLLGARTSLVHGNFPQEGEFERIQRAGASVIHCPGSHRFFQREAFALSRYQEQGINLALGTDSAASNEDLDMRRELNLVTRAFSDLEPHTAWHMATAGGARALGQGHRIGALRPGLAADMAWFASSARSGNDLVEGLVQDLAPCLGTWVAGQATHPQLDPGF